MKAIVHYQYGSPEVLKLEEVEKPVPKNNEVLLKVHATSINPYEWHHMRGTPRIMRMSMGGLFKPTHTILGNDVAGIVESVGKEVTQIKAGDAVFGESRFGGLAEYVCVSEDHLVHKPSTLSLEEAATLPIAGITALQSVRDYGKVKPGQSVLINGASGGVGSFGVQIARAYGAQVTGICSSVNVAMVKSLGADKVIDYKKDNPFDGIKYDVIIDCVGNLSISDYKKLLSPQGICAVVGFTSFARLFSVMIRRKSSKPTIGLMSAKINNQQDLIVLKDLAEKKQFKPVIDRRYPLSEASKAMKYLETGHARGKVVVTMEK